MEDDKRKAFELRVPTSGERESAFNTVYNSEREREREKNRLYIDAYAIT
jgi:hypothetical protein